MQSYDPTSLKKTIQYSQITACFFATSSAFELNYKVLQKQFTARDYDPSSMETEIEILDRKALLTLKTIQKSQVLSLIVTCNRTLLNTK